ncbi:MAG TPA: zf-HC2 domain-containing protein [Candidatus Bathyarchaeia archaeon]|nr:zf-HC2 domain-containing protein [Candidatus Bathyarchaeia archaeon]
MSAPGIPSESLTCRDVIGLLADYLESVLGQGQAERLEAHLAGCEPCRAYLSTYRRTRTLAAETGRVAMPEEMRDRLRRLLLEALAED